MAFSLSDIAVYSGQPSRKFQVFSGMPPAGTLFRIHPTQCYPKATVMYVPGEKAWYLLGGKLVKPDGQIIGGYGANLYRGQDDHGRDWIVVATLAKNGKVVKAVEQAREAWMERLDGMQFRVHPECEKEPVWGEGLGFEAMVNLAFNGRFVDNEDHPIFNNGTDPF